MYCMRRVLAMLHVSLADAAGGAGKLCLPAGGDAAILGQGHRYRKPGNV